MRSTEGVRFSCLTGKQLSWRDYRSEVAGNPGTDERVSWGRAESREAPRSPRWVLGKQPGGVVSLRLKRFTLRRRSIKIPFRVALSLLLCVTPGLSQKTQPEDSSLPKYDLHTETKTKGVIEEVNLLSVGTRKDFTELVIKNGDDKVHI